MLQYLEVLMIFRLGQIFLFPRDILSRIDALHFFKRWPGGLTLTLIYKVFIVGLTLESWPSQVGDFLIYHACHSLAALELIADEIFCEFLFNEE